LDAPSNATTRRPLLEHRRLLGRPRCAFFYTEFTRDTLRRVRDGRPPIANLADNAAAVALIEAAYAMSPLGG